MGAARYASVSDPDRNPNFRRRWDAPPLKLKRPPMGGTIERAENKISSSMTDLARILERFKTLSEAAL
jgi:hypothetical protein